MYSLVTIEFLNYVTLAGLASSTVAVIPLHYTELSDTWPLNFWSTMMSVTMGNRSC